MKNNSFRILSIFKNKQKKESENTLPLIPIDFQQDSKKFCEEEKRNINIYQSVSPGVVNISSTVYYRDFFFFEVYPQKSTGTGSGSIIDMKGHILTNYHVIKDADELHVALSDNNTYQAKIIGIDPENDLAVIKMLNPPTDLSIVPMGTSEPLYVGQKVLAIGNPYGFDRTLTEGIISGLGRPIKINENSIVENAIQTDASINPGNSGGPLLNSVGEMIGINTMIISPSGGSVGIGFAVPVSTAKNVLNDLLKFGYVRRGWLDLNAIQISPRLAKALDLSVDKGLLVTRVERNGEAYKAGLRGGNRRVIIGDTIVYLGGEIIVNIANKPINGFNDLYAALKDKKPGEVVDISYYKGYKKKTAAIKLIEKPFTD